MCECMTADAVDDRGPPFFLQRLAGIRQLVAVDDLCGTERGQVFGFAGLAGRGDRSEEHTSELQSLMRISYAVFCLKKKNKKTINKVHTHWYDMPMSSYFVLEDK